MIKLRESGVDLNETLQLTDKRSVAAFNQFLEGAESAIELRDAITGVNSELADMVETKTDNVIGASKRLSSAWEGVVLKFRSSSGLFKNILDGLANEINKFTNDNISAWDKYITTISLGIIDLAGKEQNRIDDLSKKLRTSTKQQIEFTINKNKSELENGSKVDKLILRMLTDRLAEMEQAEKESAERIANEDESNKLKAEREKTRIEEEEAKKRVKIAEKESDKKRDLLEEEVAEFSSMSEKRRKLGSKLAKENRDKEKEGLDDISKLETDKLLGHNSEKEKAAQKALDTELEGRLQHQTDINEAIELGGQAAGAINDALTSNKIANLQKEFDVLILQKEAELSNENLTAEERQKIEEKFAKKAADIKTKQAKADKRAAIISVAINTAVAVSKAFGQTGIFGIAASIPILAMGALQAGLIAAQPIPEFHTGKVGTPSEFIA